MLLNMGNIIILTEPYKQDQ